MRAQTRPRCILVFLTATVVGFALPAFGQTISYVAMPAAVGSGLQSDQVRARLSTGAHGGITVHVESADTNLVLISDDANTLGGEFVDVFVPNGSIDAIFYIQALEDTTGTATITSSATGFADGVDSVDVAVPAVQITALAPTQNVLDTNDEFTARVGLPAGAQLSQLQRVRAGGPGLTATLTNSASGVGQLVTTALTAQVVTVIIAPGQHTSPSTVAAGGVAFDGIGEGSTDVSVSIPGFIQVTTATRTVDVTPAALSLVGLPTSVGIGLQKGFLRGRISGTQHGGTTVRVESQDSSSVLISLDRYTEGTGFKEMFIPNGSIDLVFYAQVTDTASAGPVAISVSAAGFDTVVDTVHAVNGFFRLNSLASSHNTLDPLDPFTILVGLPDAQQTLIIETQQARGGGPGVTFTATSSDSMVGLLETTGGQNDTVSVTVPQGQISSPTTVAADGVAFDGVGAGTVQITAYHPNFFATAAGTVMVDVTEPGLTWINVAPEGLGAGLQSVSARVQLGGSGHGGVDVHIASGDSSLVLLSADPDSVGSDSIDVFVPNGQVNAFFYLQGTEDTTGTVTLYAEAPGFAPDSTTVDLVTPYLRIGPGSLTGSLDTLDPPDDFRANVGVVNGPTFFNRDVRPGSEGVVVTVVLDTSLAELQTQADAGDTVTVFIDELKDSSPSSFGTGGVRLDGLEPGTVTVSVSAPGFLPSTEASQPVAITAPTMSFGGLGGAKVGAGLQSNVLTVNLSASGHGGVTVHIESGDTMVSLADTTLTGIGSPSIDVDVANGQTTAPFFIQGLDDTTGTVLYTATAPGFIPVVDSVEIVQPAVDLLALDSPIDVSEGADAFWARVGVPTGNQAGLSAIQARRGGAPPLVVTLETSNSVVSQLETMDSTAVSVTVEIVAGQSISPQTVGNGGAAHLPVDDGQTLITASIPGFIQTGAAQQTVDITNNNVYITGVSGRLGAGLQTPVLTAQLGYGNHGGVTMEIAVDDTAKVLLSLNALAVGSTSLSVPLTDGSTDVPFYAQSRDSMLGTITLTASASGFMSAVDTIEIVTAGTEIIALADSMQTTDPPDEFIVRVGAIESDSSGIVEPQGVWAGSDTARVTVSSSDANIGTIKSATDSAAAVVVDIPPGNVQTATTVIGGGVAFAATGGGAATVKAEVPDFVTTAAGSTTVFVLGGPTGVEPPEAPGVFSLEQAIPNPFNPTTTIRFTLPARSHVNLSVFDVRGRHIATLVDGVMPAGRSSAVWNGRDHRGTAVSSGVYFYRLAAGANVLTKKMVLLK